MSIAVVVAHPNDEVIGAGGTIAKYTKEGEEVNTIVLFKGEESALLFKSQVLAEQKKEESKKATRILKDNIIFMDFSDDELIENANEKQAKLKELLLTLKPEKIFTHCPEDPNPSRRSIAKLIKSYDLTSEIYSFLLSNPFKLIHRNKPKLYVDISDTVILKRRAINCLKSQWYSNGIGWYLYPLVFIRDKINGFKIKSQNAEVFYKL